MDRGLVQIRVTNYSRTYPFALQYQNVLQFTVLRCWVLSYLRWLNTLGQGEHMISGHTNKQNEVSIGKLCLEEP